MSEKFITNNATPKYLLCSSSDKFVVSHTELQLQVL